MSFIHKRRNTGKHITPGYHQRKERQDRIARQQKDRQRRWRNKDKAGQPESSDEVIVNQFHSMAERIQRAAQENRIALIHRAQALLALNNVCQKQTGQPFLAPEQRTELEKEASASGLTPAQIKVQVAEWENRLPRLRQFLKET